MRVQGIRRQPHEVDLRSVLSETVREMIVERLSEDPHLVRIEEGESGNRGFDPGAWWSFGAYRCGFVGRVGREAHWI